MAAYGIYSSVRQGQKKKEADKLAKASIDNRPDYEVSPYAKAQLADSQARLNSVSPGLMAAYQQAQLGAANQMENAQRNASSGAQALAIGAGAQSEAQSILPQLAAQQDAYQQQNRQLYYGALNNMDQQHNQQFDSRLGKYSDLTNFYLGQVGAASANQSQAMGLAASGLASAASGMQGQGMGVQPGAVNMQQVPMNANAGFVNNAWSTPMAYNNRQYNPLYSSYLGY